MKLRDKETGEIWTLINRNEGTSAVLWVSNGSQTQVIESIEELASRFEDYEEPKKFWFVDSAGEVQDTTYVTDYDKTNLRKFGNYFETKEEAEKAVEKLKAWKRLKDKGFKFEGWEDSPAEDDFDMIWFTMKAKVWDIETQEALDLLFGGEE